MRFTAQLDTAPVGTYYNQLAAALKQSLPKTIRMEAAATVRRASQLQPVKPLPTAELRLRARESVIKRFSDGSIGGSVNKFTGKRKSKYGGGFAWFVDKTTARVRPVGDVWGGQSITAPQDHTRKGWRLNDAEWAGWRGAFTRAAQREKATVAARLGARGLTQKSWYDLMLKIASGEPVTGFSDTVRRARPVKGNSRDIAAAVGVKNNGGFELTVVNASGLAAATGGQRKLNSAISIRRKFFLRSLNQGFLSDAKFVARNYPWATVSG
jgi:hypothetical protein